MLVFNIFRCSPAMKSYHLQNVAACVLLNYRCYYHFVPNAASASESSISAKENLSQNKVAIFWDLDNKPPKSYPPYDAAIQLRKSMAEFGVVRYTVAYANHHSFRYVPPEVREQRKERKALNELENKGIVKPEGPYLCRVCGRKFYANDRLVNHFKIHERENQKRLNQIESSKGGRRVNLVAKYSMKMNKYKSAARDTLTPKVGYGLADELKRAGFWVRTVSDKPQAADIALKERMVDMMDRKLAECVVLISDDSDFVEILKEAKLRCLKTVVVGDSNNGTLKRIADVAYSWQEIMMGKARKQAASVVGRWKDGDILKQLEWVYDRDRDRRLYGLDDYDDDDELEFEGEIAGFLCEEENDMQEAEKGNAWWELESDSKIREFDVHLP
ncbi:uncharacterized protein LOC124926052 [Impatiens glandulifera]|uniref:uncharacterized protein LOC124926052 n=1 Tax=Impatiens glandulifera TaxID=253017 RepID=UPI001FB0DE4A|nr:uncharacterized protein LOC124926052 [Impatiens glandulifera]